MFAYDPEELFRKAEQDRAVLENQKHIHGESYGINEALFDLKRYHEVGVITISSSRSLWTLGFTDSWEIRVDGKLHDTFETLPQLLNYVKRLNKGEV